MPGVAEGKGDCGAGAGLTPRASAMFRPSAITGLSNIMVCAVRPTLFRRCFSRRRGGPSETERRGNSLRCPMSEPLLARARPRLLRGWLPRRCCSVDLDFPKYYDAFSGKMDVPKNRSLTGFEPFGRALCALGGSPAKSTWRAPNHTNGLSGTIRLLPPPSCIMRMTIATTSNSYFARQLRNNCCNFIEYLDPAL